MLHVYALVLARRKGGVVALPAEEHVRIAAPGSMPLRDVEGGQPTQPTAAQQAVERAVAHALSLFYYLYSQVKIFYVMKEG